MQAGEGEGRWKPEKSAYWENHALDCGRPHVTTTIAQRCYPVLEPTGH